MKRKTLDGLVDAFAAAMRAKLRKKEAEGLEGWDDPTWALSADLKQKLLRHIEKGDPVDVANFCAFWWNAQP